MVIYRSLNQVTNEFRLFRMRESINRHDPIIGDLEYHDLSRPPSFHAISYYCGGPEQNGSIMVNSQHLKVVKNCEEVLQELRAREVRLVWVDQICIDQETHDEKSAQILRIHAVYSAAKAVIVWLGPHADDSRQLLQRDMRSLTWGHLNMESFLQIQINAFFLRRYWKRAWIVQEIAAATQLLIWCGDCVVGWDTIEHLLDIWLAYRVDPDVKYANVGYATLLDLYQKRIREEAELYCLRFVRDSQTKGHAFTLLKLLQVFHRSQAGDPRDKVYAFLGLAWDRAHFITEPSYNPKLSVRQICLDMTRACILRKRSLDIIFFAGARSTSISLPSWCPNYISLAGDLIATNLTIYLSSQEARHRLGAEGYRWQTTAESFATPETFLIYDDCLVTQACCVDSIVGLARLPHEGENHRHDDRELSRSQRQEVHESMANALHMYDKNYARYPTRPVQPFALYSPQLRIQGLKSKLEDHRDVIREWRERHKDFRVGGKSIKDLASPVGISQFEVAINPGSYARGLENLKRLGRGVFDRNVSLTSMHDWEQMSISFAIMFREGLRLAVTAHNRIGWAHPDAQIGDKIYLLAGCSMPAILRPNLPDTESFRLIGHGYFDGMMDGKLWTEKQQSAGARASQIQII